LSQNVFIYWLQSVFVAVGFYSAIRSNACVLSLNTMLQRYLLLSRYRIAGPQIWNSLQDCIRYSESIGVLRSIYRLNINTIFQSTFSCLCYCLPDPCLTLDNRTCSAFSFNVFNTLLLNLCAFFECWYKSLSFILHVVFLAIPLSTRGTVGLDIFPQVLGWYDNGVKLPSDGVWLSIIWYLDYLKLSSFNLSSHLFLIRNNNDVSFSFIHYSPFDHNRRITWHRETQQWFRFDVSRSRSGRHYRFTNIRFVSGISQVLVSVSLRFRWDL